jgi:hypothetical protein
MKNSIPSNSHALQLPSDYKSFLKDVKEHIAQARPHKMATGRGQINLMYAAR